MFSRIPGFYSTSAYTAVIFSTHLVTVKGEVFTTTTVLVPGKYSYTLSQQPSLSVPPYFLQIAYASLLCMHEDLSERGLSKVAFTFKISCKYSEAQKSKLTIM